MADRRVLAEGAGNPRRSRQDSPIFTESEWADLTRSLSLSPRQSDIVKCLFRGCGDKQTARRLGISVNTVRDYMGRMFLKLGVEDRVELILRVVSRFLDDRRSNTNKCHRAQ